MKASPVSRSNGRHVFVATAMALLLGCTALLSAQSPEGIEQDLEDLVLSATDDQLEQWGVENLSLGAPVRGYDSEGYPEDESGQLVLREHPAGPMVYVEDDEEGHLLYAQFVNRQRDAVFLARTGTVSDPLPDGTAYTIPFGFGALKENESVLSVVEARVVPHFGDNRKSYTQFPLQDVYIGAAVGWTGITATARYVLQETYVASVRVGLNTFSRLNPSSILNTYWVPIHVGGGYRFPGIFPELIGDNLITVGADLFLGLGDRDSDPDTSAAVLLPGVAASLERLLFTAGSSQIDFREDPRPYNYRVSSVSLDLGVYVDVPTFARGGSLIRVALSAGVQFNLFGPSIPEHEFKTTDVRYVHEYYLEDLVTQEARRRARSDD